MDKVQVLIVEDEAIVSMDLRYKLEALGYSVPAEISSGEEAVEAAIQLHPDLILMDIRLSGEIDGIEAAAQIRRQFDVPVVYVTAYANGDALAQAEMRSLVGDLLKAEGIPLDSSSFGTVRLEQDHYTQVPLVVEFTCGVEQMVNLMATMANSARLLTTREIRVQPQQREVKSIHVRMTVVGYLPVDRTPELLDDDARAAL